MPAASPHPLEVAPSILAADFARLGAEVAEVAPAVSTIHLDVMDGHYVPNISLGMPVIRSLRATTDLRFDCHLMVSDPVTYGPLALEAGGDSVTFHPFVVDDPLALVRDLKARGGAAGVAVRPSERVEDLEPLLEEVDLVLVMSVEPGFGGQPFIPASLAMIEHAASWRERHGAGWRLQVDGGIGRGTIGRAAAAGADLFVAGTAVFDEPDRAAAALELRELARAAAVSPARSPGAT